MIEAMKLFWAKPEVQMFKKPIPRKIAVYYMLSIIGIIAFWMTDGTFSEWLGYWFLFYTVPLWNQIGYHRWLAHRMFEPYVPYKWLLLYSMVLSGLAAPLKWVYAHRVHHITYDHPINDPHPNTLGLMRLFFGDFNVPKNTRVPLKDVIREKGMMFIERNFIKLQILNLTIFWLIDPHLAMLTPLFAMVRPMVHVTTFNFAGHNWWGKKRIQTNIEPWWLQPFLISKYAPEHGNHHDDPRCASFSWTTDRSADSRDLAFEIMKHMGVINWDTIFHGMLNHGELPPQYVDFAKKQGYDVDENYNVKEVKDES